ncbi:unnamed protein product [Spirodela intermedia]|uniref:Uncharacterized protein n=2 Tax=Spirodela intermedia TaxID=51605 RepID=A0A811GAB7_SPIIN|nr:unnamed protein product [Spirodela intermedia]
MEDFRSRSSGDGRMQMEVYGGRGPAGGGGGGGGVHEQRGYGGEPAVKEMKLKKGKGGGASKSGGWSFSDPELQRKKRVASYKVYAVEGKMKGSLRKSFRWLKDRCSQVVYGWR